MMSFVSKMMNFVLKMMNFAGSTAVLQGGNFGRHPGQQNDQEKVQEARFRVPGWPWRNASCHETWYGHLLVYQAPACSTDSLIILTAVRPARLEMWGFGRWTRVFLPARGRGVLLSGHAAGFLW